MKAPQRTIASLAVLVSAMAPIGARADFATASQAYDAGDYRAAAAQWRDLAIHCDAKAQTAFAGLLHAGLGVPQNDIEALRWYLMAAWAGERFAQQIAGEWYEQGDTVPADRVRAAFWFTLAAEQGLRWSGERRKRIVETLDGDARTKLGERLATYRSAAVRMCGDRR